MRHSRFEEEPSENGWSDSAFLEMARNGGQGEAYLLLCAELGRLRVYLSARFALDLGGVQGVEEILHDTARKAIESIQTYEPERGGVRFWAWKLGVNLAIDKVRSECSQRARERAVARSESTVVDELLDQLHEAIECLIDPYRGIVTFDLEHGGRGPSEDLAARLGVTTQTIYNWRRQAHGMLRQLLS